MRKLGVAACFCLLGASALVGSIPLASGRPQPAEACSPGPHKIKLKGQDAIRFCGSAKATVKVGSRTLRYTGGHCQTVSSFYTVNIGTSVGPSFKEPKPDYFGITADKAKPGATVAVAIAIHWGGKPYVVVNPTLRLAAGSKRGTIAGRVLASKNAVSGSFSC